MSRAYNPIYPKARADVIASEQEAESIARHLLPVWETRTDEEIDRVHDFILCAEENDMPRPDPLVTARLDCTDCPAKDPRSLSQLARDLDDAETAQTRKADYPQ